MLGLEWKYISFLNTNNPVSEVLIFYLYMYDIQGNFIHYNTVYIVHLYTYKVN